jgi:K+-sensing histidine kinase KdpD
MTRKTLDDDLTLAFILGRDGDRLSFAGAVALSFVACLGLAAVAASGFLSGDLAFASFVLVAVVMSWWSAPVTAAVVAFVAFLFANGFAYDTVGTLTWHGEADLLRLVCLVGVSLTVSVLGYGRTQRSRHRSSDSEPRASIAS